jgi:hypothetical protein
LVWVVAAPPRRTFGVGAAGVRARSLSAECTVGVRAVTEVCATRTESCGGRRDVTGLRVLAVGEANGDEDECEHEWSCMRCSCNGLHNYNAVY